MMVDASARLPPNILDLPNEILLHILSYLPPKFLITTTPLISTQFHSLTKYELYWKTKIRIREGVRLADCQLKRDGFNAKKTFVAIHENKERWKNWDEQIIKTALGHSATVDSVFLFNSNHKKFCLSGSRDRSLRLWDVDNIESGDDSEDNKWTSASLESAHLGWIWNITKDDSDNFYTTSWDSTVKCWKLQPSGITPVHSIQLGSAVQCAAVLNENEIVCSSFAKRVAVVDTRSFEVVAEHSLHKSAVLSVACDGDRIFSSGEDRLMIMTDRRMMTKPALFNYNTCGYTSYLSLQGDQLLTALSNGFAHLLDARNFKLLNSFKVGTFTRQVILNDGAHFVMAKQHRNCRFGVYTPGTKNTLVCASGELEAEPAKFHYLPSSKIVAIGNGDSSVMFCIPRTNVD